MIRVAVTMHGNLRRFLPQGVGSTSIEMFEGATVADLIAKLAAGNEVWIASIDDSAVPVTKVLADGMAIDFFPHLEGG